MQLISQLSPSATDYLENPASRKADSFYAPTRTWNLGYETIIHAQCYNRMNSCCLRSFDFVPARRTALRAASRARKADRFGSRQRSAQHRKSQTTRGLTDN